MRACYLRCLTDVKLRIRDNSIRLRLTRGEVDQLAAEGRVESAVHFADGAVLAYCCERVPDLAAPAAEFDQQALIVRLPAAAVDAWARSEQVSIDGEQALAGGDRLALLVEKDFACLAAREGEDESDMFAHPMESSQRC